MSKENFKNKYLLRKGKNRRLKDFWTVVFVF